MIMHTDKTRVAISPPSLVLISALVICALLTTSCAGPHVEITRMLGMFPPNLEDRSDFYDDAIERCKKYQHLPSAASGMVAGTATPSRDCVEYWEAVLWAQDYRDYASSRAALNRNIIYWGAVVALAGAGALVGLAAFGHTNSDAFKLIPIVGTFLGGVMSYSKNDALYEAYETTSTKIDQVLRAGQEKVSQNPPSYNDAATMIRRDVGSAVDELTQKRMDIVKFQAQSEADQFKAVRTALADRDLGLLKLTDAKTNAPLDPTQIIVSLNSAFEPQKVPASEIRIRLSDINGPDTYTLRVSTVVGADLTANIPPDVLNHGPKTYRTEVLARNGEYSIRDNKQVTLTYSNVRLAVVSTGPGSVTYTGMADGLVPRGVVTHLSATYSDTGSHVTWKNQPGCLKDATICDITPTEDTKVEAEFTK